MATRQRKKPSQILAEQEAAAAATAGDDAGADTDTNEEDAGTDGTEDTDDIETDAESGDENADTGQDEDAGDEEEDDNDTIQKLQKQLKDKDTELADTRKKNEELEGTVRNSALAQAETYMSKVDTDIEAFTSQLDKLESEAETLLDSGDNKAYVKKQREINALDNKLTGAKNVKGRLEGDIEKIKKAPVAKPGAATQVQQPVFTDRTQQWIDAHPQWNTDPEFQAEAVAADAAYDRLFSAGKVTFERDSDEYFKFCEERMRKNGANFGEAGKGKTPPRDKPTGQGMAAPASRNGQGAGQGARTPANKIRLSSEEVEAAKVCGMTPQEYAKAKYPNGKK